MYAPCQERQAIRETYAPQPEEVGIRLDVTGFSHDGGIVSARGGSTYPFIHRPIGITEEIDRSVELLFEQRSAFPQFAFESGCFERGEYGMRKRVGAYRHKPGVEATEIGPS